ncbi:hypothetical protein MLD52_22450 [Puniceicoccaceae bacterium K14]|nr:hypothetical protein [Puniceicoccaceae bacterium K14]
MNQKPDTPPAWLTLVSHFVPPVTFGFLAYLELAPCHTVRWETILIFTLATSPFILILLSIYVKKLKIGNNEIETASKSEASKEYIKSKELKKEDQPVDSNTLYDQFAWQTKKVFKTLWFQQKKLFGLDGDKRFGFTIGPYVPDHKEFRYGVFELLNHGLIIQDENGMIYLTSKGIDFSRSVESKLDNQGIWNDWDN